MNVTEISNYIFEKYDEPVKVYFDADISYAGQYDYIDNYIILKNEKYSNCPFDAYAFLHEYGHFRNRDSFVLKLFKWLPILNLSNDFFWVVLVIAMLMAKIPIALFIAFNFFLFISSALVAYEEYRADAFAYTEGVSLGYSARQYLLIGLSNTGLYVVSAFFYAASLIINIL